MAGDSIKVNHDVLGSAAGQFASQGESLEASRKSVETAAATFAGAWQGTAADAFFEAAGTLLIDFAIAVEGVDVLSGKLSQADATFTDADLSLASSIEGGSM